MTGPDAARKVTTVIAILIITVLALAAAAFAAYRFARISPRASESFFQPGPVGLFDNAEIESEPAAEDKRPTKRAVTIERAARGDLGALAEAHASTDEALYSQVLTALEQASMRQEAFRALVTHIAQSNELRANTRLTERVMAEWKTAPDRRATIELLHIAALSDDAATYQSAVETVFEYWRRGRLVDFNSKELLELFVSQFWVIAPEARRRGAGFALKRKLLNIRRELAGPAPAR